MKEKTQAPQEPKREELSKKLIFNLRMLAAIVQFEFLYHRSMISESLEEIMKVPENMIPKDINQAIRDYEHYRYFRKPKPEWLS